MMRIRSNKKIRLFSLIIMMLIFGTLLNPFIRSIIAIENPSEENETDILNQRTQNEDWETAEELIPGENYTDTLSLRNQVDWWKVWVN